MNTDKTPIVVIVSLLIFSIALISSMSYRMHLQFLKEQLLYSACLESGGLPNYDDDKINCEKKQ